MRYLLFTLLFIATFAVGYLAMTGGLALSTLRHIKEPTSCLKNDASADTSGTGTSGSGLSPSTHSKGVALAHTTTGRNLSTTIGSPDGTAHAQSTAPKPSPMLTELQRHFSKWEAEQLEALYLETRKDVEFYALPAELRERMPAPTTSLADVRKRVKDIVGVDGFKTLMKEACPPKEVKPNTAEMEQFVLSNPQLVWWSQLLE